MRCVMLWHGGSSYAAGTTSNEDDLEAFDTIAEAVEAFKWRAAKRDPFYPCVEGSSAWLWLDTTPAAVAGLQDAYPDRTLTQGPRDGVQMSRA